MELAKAAKFLGINNHFPHRITCPMHIFLPLSQNITWEITMINAIRKALRFEANGRELNFKIYVINKLRSIYDTNWLVAKNFK